MTWATRFRLRQSVRQSLWMLPLCGAVAGTALAWLVESAEGSSTCPLR
jgi:hypothetical protein